MEPQDYPIAHFEHIGRLAQSLKALPAQVLEHDYSYELFGSWHVVIRHNGVVSRLVFDGRDNHLALQQSADRKAPYQYGAEHAVESGTHVDVFDAEVIEKICSAITQQSVE